MNISDYSLIIFDVDGTLVRTKSRARFRDNAEDWEWIEGRKERIEQLSKQGIKIGIATNQGGVAFGYLNAQDMIRELVKLKIEAYIDFMEVCFDHPNATVEEYKIKTSRRKPGPGMIFSIIEEAEIIPKDVLMVGDREEDKEASKAAGVDFLNAEEFFAKDQEEIAVSEWKIKAVRYLLELNDLKMVEKDRLYTCSEHFGKSRYHLTETEWDSFHITEENTGDKWNKKVTIDDEELPHLLKFLLDRYHQLYRDKFDQKHPNHAMTTDSDDILGDLDDHPF